MRRFEIAERIYFEHLGEVRIGTIIEVKDSVYRVMFHGPGGLEPFVLKKDAFKTLEDWARNLIGVTTKRFWISWYSYSGETPKSDSMFSWWISGDTWINGKEARCICAIVDAESEDKAWDKVLRYFNVVEKRFCNEKDLDWKPNDRFQ